MVSKIHIERYKSILDQQIELRSLNVLIGQNGAGKSNFISFFKFLERLSEQQIKDYIFNYGGINNFLYNGYPNSNFIKASIEFTNSSTAANIYKFGLLSNGEDYRFNFESVAFWGKSYKEALEVDITSNSHETNLKKSTKYYAKYIFDYIKNLKVFHFHDTSENAHCKLPQDIDNVYTLENEAQNIAPFLNFLRNNKSETYFRIVETIRLVYPKFNDFELKESPTAKGKIVLRWTEKGNENIFTSKQISDGTLRFICLATVLLQPKESQAIPKTILLDEPELGLHPFAIHVLSELIKKASLERQIILSTQSVTLINYFEPEDLLIVERSNEGDTIFIRKENDTYNSWLEDYSLGQLWENNFLGGKP